VNASKNLCPACGNKNDESATICINCGSQLEEAPTKLVSISEKSDRQSKSTPEHMGASIDISLIPADGIGIYVAGEIEPIYVQIYKDLIVGRPVDATLEAVLDFTSLNGANLGVSKRHAMIRRTASGYEVLDLGSRNGTWLNSERLVPNKPYPLPSGSQLRLGKMSILVMYHPR